MTPVMFSDYEMYLYFGYLPKFSEADLQWLNCDYDNDFGKGIDNEEWWICEGVKALKRTMEDQVGSIDQNTLHILPLSGGLDSRVILGGLLEQIPKAQIIAATYGMPGTWDFEIARTLTRKFGIQHEVFNLLDEKWDLDELVRAATRLSRPVNVYHSYVRQKINNHFGADCAYWSGFMGDSLAGVDLIEVPNKDKWEAIKEYFELKANRVYKTHICQDELFNKILLECPWNHLDQPKFCLGQQLDFGIVERHLTQPIVIVNGFHFVTPFLSKIWVNFISNVPYKWLFKQYLYKRIIQECYKEVSLLPAKITAGMPLTASRQRVLMGKVLARVKPYISPRDPYRSHPRTIYINWTEALRQKGKFQNSVYSTLECLKSRSIFDNKEIDTWWRDHLCKKENYTFQLMNLSSLELLLRAGKI